MRDRAGCPTRRADLARDRTDGLPVGGGPPVRSGPTSHQADGPSPPHPEDSFARWSSSISDPARSRIELEINESVVMDQSEVGIRTLSRLRDMGVRLVLDDFGTG